MGTAQAPLPVKLVVPMFTGEPELFEIAEAALQQRFGPVDYRSPRLPFEHTDYYTPEFGPGLQRWFVALERLIDPGELASIKRWTNELELSLAREGRRRINLDPGYVSSAKLVLATTKNHNHRIYIGQGIYAEVTLVYRDKNFRPWPWTYPDYASEAYIAILREIRELYMAQLRRLRQEGKLERSL
ncbi:MAG: DUF4416 family protein [Chloroflexi bacterium]|nr:DUF4416 family protein [Chloroflexota bacterium]